MDGGILLLFHCRSNTGYAIGSLERVFHGMAKRLVKDEERIFYAYPSLSGGVPAHLPPTFSRLREVDPGTTDVSALRSVTAWVRAHDIRIVHAFDLPIQRPILKALRRGGVRVIISYWGASISSVYPWWLRPARKLQFLTARNRPDHFIFESEGMRLGATYGSMIPRHQSSVCHLGVDETRFHPAESITHYAHDTLGIPRDRRIVFFSGHMEQRKGVHVLVKAMVELAEVRKRSDIHLLVCGNQPGEELAFSSLYTRSIAASYITFGGYRTDMPELHRSAYLGAIASTGWDSYTMSAVEMASSGLPLLVSDLPGLAETVIDGVTGRIFRTGDAGELASHIEHLVDHPDERHRMGVAARERVLGGFTRAHQENRLLSVVSAACRNAGLIK